MSPTPTNLPASLPAVLVDFNDLITMAWVLFAQHHKVDAHRQAVDWHAGLRVRVCDGLRTGDGVGCGTFAPHAPGQLGWPPARWRCCIDENGQRWRTESAPAPRASSSPPAAP